MNPAFREKHFYHRATRHAAEGYSPVLAPDGRTLAFLQVSAESETLMLQRAADEPALAISSPGYLFSPCFAGEWLVWVEQRGERWGICGARWRDTKPVARALGLRTEGRPLHLVASGDWLAWEERIGRATILRVTRLAADGTRSEPHIIGEPSVNAYDPALAIAADGTAYCAYTAYADDNYRIFLAHLAADGTPLGAPVRVSDRSEACV